MLNVDRLHILELARVGDRVFHNANETDLESWAYHKAKKEPMQGKVGTITSFSSVPWYIPRFGVFKKKGLIPGLYTREVSVDVMWDDGTVTQGQDLADLSLMVPKFYESLPHFEYFQTLRNYNRMTIKDRQAERTEDRDLEDTKRMTYVGPLPDLFFYELDEVNTRHGRGYVRSLNWQYLDQRRDDGSLMPMYDVSLDDGGSMSFGEEELSLARRGNVWDWYQGKRDFDFASTEEAYRFFSGLGLLNQVRNAQDNYGGVSFEVACQRIRGGEADVMISNSGRNRNTLYTLYKGTTEEVTKLVRSRIRRHAAC